MHSVKSAFFQILAKTVMVLATLFLGVWGANLIENHFWRPVRQKWLKI